MENRAMKRASILPNQANGNPFLNEQILKISNKIEERLGKLEKEFFEKKKDLKEIKNKMIVVDEKIVISGRKY